MIPDSPVVDMLRAAQVFERRLPTCYHGVIRREMWLALGEYLELAGGHAKEDVHILAPLGHIVGTNALAAMGRGN